MEVDLLRCLTMNLPFSDGDGVNDCDDKCPNSQAGQTIGPDGCPVPISIDKKTIVAALKSGKFISHTVTLEHKGERQLVFAQDIQFHPVTDEPTHLDLYRVEPGQIIRVAVPVHVTGQGVSPGIKRGGALQIVEHSVELLVPSDAIPDAIE